YGNLLDERLGVSLVGLISLRNRLVQAHRYRYVEVGKLIVGARKLVDDVFPIFREWVYALIKKCSKACEKGQWKFPLVHPSVLMRSGKIK
ncbi:hypothetical protein KEJ36_06090, partial [Candidatus Bathyarchaeota archaeon]|nr:hypothetical protein [Candidatus Bathyarchaeota archaeon]